ncbi:MFS transporter [Sphingobium boeckii]|uniref:GPH family glycoside/pentoside/hexuronide:cation symporter n=1 Tax=Sphingobium boeckii TaxID=1082345 RepID=A0A7W9EG59_9SPHN|nr:MFS transporter [Sphingobium boeckii]MBB5686406.1 GPH family glycoside/pentoside/hexuronide:cation symporter [Sphingobium boeckii]
MKTPMGEREPAEEPLLPLSTRLGWGLGSFPMASLNLAAGTLLVRYMTDTLGVAAALAATLFSVAKIWDAVSDPIIGHMSDRINTPWGRRLPWMLTGGLLSAVVLVATYTAPVSGDILLPGFLLIMMLLFATSYTMFMIPYMAMPAEITSSYNGRSQLMSFRVVCNSAGSFIGLGLAPMMLGLWGATRAGHLKMAMVIAAIATIGVLVSVYLLRKAPRAARPAQAPMPFFRQLASAVQIPPFAWLLLSKVLYFLTLAFTLTAMPYFTKHVLRISDAWLGTMLISQTAALMLSQPFWLWIARTLDKRRGYLMAAALYGAGCLSYWIADTAEPMAITLARCIMLGFAGGGTFLLSQAMLPDVMEYDYHINGVRREGTFAGLFIMVEQLAGALGIAFFGWSLGAFGYAGGFEGVRVDQPQSAIDALRVCVTIVPAVFIALSMLSIGRYKLSNRMLDELRAKPAH